MRTILSTRPAFLAACGLMLCTGLANAGLYGSGTLTTTSLGNDEYFVTGITGTLNGDPVTLLPTTDPLPNPFPTQCPGTPQDYGAAEFAFNDIVYFPGFPGTTTICQTAGLLLDSAGLGVQAGGIAYNLIGYGAGYDYFLSSGAEYQMTFTISPASSDPTFTFSIASVPEPATLALLGVGLAGIAFAALRRRKARSEAPVS